MKISQKYKYYFLSILIITAISAYLIIDWNSDFVNIGYQGKIYKVRLGIHDEKDVIEKRGLLINEIFKENNLPQLQPSNIDYNIYDKQLSGLVNLKKIDKLFIPMEYGINSTILHLQPKNMNGKLVIYHEGHAQDLDKRSVEYFLSRGYSVLAISMPLYGRNGFPHYPYPKIQLPSGEEIELTMGVLEDDKLHWGHNSFKYFESKNFSPLKLFLKPITVSINYIEDNFNYTEINMVGISGGAWTTLLYSSIDPRIQKVYTISAPLPSFVLEDYKKTQEYNLKIDYEDNLLGINHISNYLELYILSSFGENRKYVQIINKYDPSIYRGDSYTAYEQIIQGRISKIKKGSFVVYSDNSHYHHIISDVALSRINMYMFGLNPYVDELTLNKTFADAGYNVSFNIVDVPTYSPFYSGMYLLINAHQGKITQITTPILYALYFNTTTDYYGFPCDIKPTYIDCNSTKKNNKNYILLPRKYIGDIIFQSTPNQTYYSDPYGGILNRFGRSLILN